MPIIATIAPSITRTQTADFQFTIEFVVSGSQTLDPMSFTLANIVVMDGSDVDTSDMTLVSVTGEAAIIRVALPTDVSGDFTVGVTGDVTVDGTAEMLSGAAKRINYDTMTSLGASFGKPSYRGAGELAIPVTFAEDVIAPSQTIFSLTHIAGGAVRLIDAYIVGATREYELILLLPRDSDGLFTIAATGTVFKTFSGTYDSVTLTPMLVAWSYLLAEISVLTTPKEVAKGVFEVEVETTLPTKSLDINSFNFNIATESRVLFRSQSLEERPDNPPFVSKVNIALPECFESWDRVVDNDTEHSGRFFLLRFKREYPTEMPPPEVRFIGEDLE